MDVCHDKGGQNKQYKDQRNREILKKTQEARLKWYRHVMRSDGESDEKRTLNIVQGKRRRGRPKTR